MRLCRNVYINHIQYTIGSESLKEKFGKEEGVIKAYFDAAHGTPAATCGDGKPKS